MSGCSFDHIDLRVPDLAAVSPFYQMLLPALGFVNRVDVEGWLQYETSNGATGPFFGITGSPGHVPNENRIAFQAPRAEEVNRIATVARNGGAMNIEGPMEYEPGYYAVFFEDPCGNRFEVCHRDGGYSAANG